jgi:RND family efflux transporter MFP subunit
MGDHRFATAFLAAWLLAAPAAAQDAAPPPTVTVANPLVQELVEWTEFTGQFAAVDYVEIRARVSGYLDTVGFEDGQLVEAGDLLFEIDPRPFQAAVAAAEAQKASAEARLELADQQLDRARALLQSNNIPAETFDQRVQEVRVAQAGVQEADAALIAARLDLEYTRITAPIAGRIGAKAITPGNLVVGGASGTATLLTTIVSLDPIYFEFDISEASYLAYQRAIARGELPAHRDGGVQVEAGLFDDTGWPYHGRIDFVDNRVDRSSGTIRMRAIFPNTDLFLTAGQFGRLRLPGSPRYAAILLPDEAILSDQDRRIVLTVDDAGIVVAKVVRPGPRELGLRIIRSGLEPTDRVIINGLMRARPGTPVTVEEGTIALPEAAADAGSAG